MKINKNYAKLFFLKHLSQYSACNLIEIKQIHRGYTNISFLIKTNDGKLYQVRFSKSTDLVDRNCEQAVLKLVDQNNYLYYDKNGNAIKRWIVGRNLKCSDLSNDLISKIIDQINFLHKIKPNDKSILINDYKSVFNDFKIAKKYHILYKQIYDTFDSKKWVLSHNDLNFHNILINEENDIFFIDYEWARINHELFDIANFIRECDLNIKQINFIATRIGYDIKEILKIVYVCTVFAQTWAHQNKISFRIIWYRIINKRRLIKYYQLLINNKKFSYFH